MDWRQVKKVTMRVRIKFAKIGALRYIGHLDLHKIWERSSRRAGLALVYSQGFHPQPKIQLASALPLGFSSRCELVDLWISGDIDISALPSIFTRAVPSGLEILSAAEVPEKNPPLQTQVISAVYEITFLDLIDQTLLENQISNILNAESLPRQRRGKDYDLRPLVESIHVLSSEPHPPVRLSMQLAAREGATGRPEEVLDSLGIPLDVVRIERSELIFKNPA